MKKFLIMALSVLILSACGVKGDLYLPGEKPPHSHRSVDSSKKTDAATPDKTENKDGAVK